MDWGVARLTEACHRHGLSVVMPPAEPVVSIAEARAHLRISADARADDDAILALCYAAGLHLEVLTGKALITQTLQLSLSTFPVNELTLLRWPVQSVEEITYVDTDGETQTLDENLYQVGLDQKPVRVARAYGKCFPYARPQYGSVKVRYVAGYGDHTQVPADLKAAAKLMIGHLYTNRGAKDAEIPPAVKSLLSAHWMGGFLGGPLGG